MGRRVRYDVGGEGEASAFAGEVLTLTAPRAFAPGAPVALVVAVPAPAPAVDDPSRAPATHEDAWLAVSGKTISCKRRSDGHFDLRLRMVSLTRASRERLAAALT